MTLDFRCRVTLRMASPVLWALWASPSASWSISACCWAKASARSALSISSLDRASAAISSSMLLPYGRLSCWVCISTAGKQMLTIAFPELKFVASRPSSTRASRLATPNFTRSPILKDVLCKAGFVIASSSMATFSPDG